MTKQEFLSGMCFTIGAPTYKGANTYSYHSSDSNEGCIMRQSRSSLDNRVVLNDYSNLTIGKFNDHFSEQLKSNLTSDPLIIDYSLDYVNLLTIHISSVR